MSDGRSSRLDRLAVAFGCSREDNREIGSWKQLKSVIFSLQENYPGLFNYKRDLWLWGPESSEYGKDFNNLLLRPGKFVNDNGLLSGYLFFRKRMNSEPIHHMYTVSRIYLSPLFSSLEKLSNDEEIPYKTKEEFIADSIIRTKFIPSEIMVNASLKISDKAFWDNADNVELENRLKKWPVMRRYNLKDEDWTEPVLTFNEDMISNLLKIYKEMGIVLEEKGTNKFSVKIPSYLENKYNYLNPTRPEIKDLYADLEFSWDKVGSSTLVYLKMHELLENINEFGKLLEQRLNETVETIHLNELYEEYKKEKIRCREIFSATESGDLYLSFNKDNIVLDISDELKSELKKRSKILYSEPTYHPTAYLYYFHILQPIEMAMTIQQYGVNLVKEKLSNNE